MMKEIFGQSSQHVYPPWCKIQNYYLYVQSKGYKPCTKFSIDQLRGQKTQWAVKSGLTLTFKHVTWKSIGIIYSLRATPEQSLVLIKWGSQKILNGQHSWPRRVVWPWPLNMWPSLVLIKWWGQKILSGQHTGLERVVWPSPLNMWPENK